MNITILRKIKSNNFSIYIIMMLLGVVGGISGIPFIVTSGVIISQVFIKLFQCLSIPIISLSIIVTLSSELSSNMNHILRRTAMYTLTTTVIAASISCALFLLIKPENVSKVLVTSHSTTLAKNSFDFLQYLSTLIPSNFISPFLENKVISVLLVSLVIGIAIRYIADEEAKKVMINFFRGLHGLFFVMTKWVVAILPIGLFGFIVTTVSQIQQGMNLKGLGEYLAVIVAANLIQGLIVLPAWLKLKGISPFNTMKGMMPALSLAFFSKSSAGTLPVTISTAETNLQMDSRISRLVLPLCTSINMNGCAAFIFTTVIYLMQNAGLHISFGTMALWIVISTIAAIGNAGVPMGCYFLSASLLASMNVPIILMGVILPFYSVIDMIETTLNVWSDSCVAKVIDEQGLREVEDLPQESGVPAV